jgi:bacterial peptide chain release factor 2 (bRF-2)
MEVAGALEDPQVWNDPKRAQELGRERKSLETVVLGLESLTTALADHSELFEMSREEGDDATCESIEADVEKSAAEVEALEFRRMFSNPLDPSNCFIDIQAGAGAPRPATGPACCCASTCATANARASRPR